MKTITIFNFNELKESVQKKVLLDFQFDATNKYLEQEFEEDMKKENIECNFELIIGENWRKYILDYEIMYYNRGYENYYTVKNIIWNDSLTDVQKDDFEIKIKSKIKLDLEKTYEYAYSKECVMDYIEVYNIMFTKAGQVIYNY